MNKFDYIVNPTTGRKVNVNTRLGKNILLNYKNINQMGGLGLPFKILKLEQGTFIVVIVKLVYLM